MEMFINGVCREVVYTFFSKEICKLRVVYKYFLKGKTQIVFLSM